jgi:hypothetical protein
LTDTSAFDASLMDLGFCPDERLGMLVVGVDEGIDVLPELLDRGEGGAVQGLLLQDGEPDLDLVEPRGSGRREVETNVGMTLEPAVVLGLVGVEGTSKNAPVNDGLAMDADVLWFRRGFVGAGRAFRAS